MNTLCFSSIFVKLTYFTYIGSTLDSALNEDKFADFSTALFFFDSLNNIEAFQFLLIAISFVKTLVVWLPATFKLVSDLLGRFFNRQSLVILLLAVGMATVGTALLGAALGPFVLGFQDVRSMTTRAAILVEAGWFWQTSEEYGIKEDLPSMEGQFVAGIFAALTFYIWALTIMTTALFIGKILEDLAKARKVGKQLQDLKYRNEIRMIEL